MSICSQCEKPIDSRNKKGVCQECIKKLAQEKRDNKKKNAQQKLSPEESQIHKRENYKRWCLNHPERLKESSHKRCKKYYSTHSKQILKRLKNIGYPSQKKWRLNNQEQCRERNRDYAKKAIKHLRWKYVGVVICPKCRKKGYEYNSYATNTKTGHVFVTKMIRHSHTKNGQLIIDDYCSFGYETLEKGIYLMKKETESISVNSA